MKCDCLNYCGDDPWLKDGRAQPCQNLLNQRHKDTIYQAKMNAATHLCQKFGVTDLLDLIQAQDTHIQRLEQKA